MALIATLDQTDLTDIFRTSHPKAAEYTFFSSVHETFSRIDHVPGHKSALDKYKKIKIIPRIFSDHNTMKLDINPKKKFEKPSNTWRLKNILLKNEWANQEIKEEIKKYMEANENDSATAQNLWDTAKVAIRGTYSNPGLPKEGRKMADTQPNLTLCRAGKTTANKPKTDRKSTRLNSSH